MATEVLYPQDVLLAQRLRPHASAFAPRRKPHPHNPHTRSNPGSTNPSSSSSTTTSTCRSSISSNPRPSRKAPAADQKRRREGSGSPPPKAQLPPHVTVLRRGESLDSVLGGSSRPNLPNRKQGPYSSTTGLLSSARGGDLMAPARLSPPRPAGDDVYAGSAFSVSPAPSALPLPSFFSAKKEERALPPPAALLEVGPVDHSATKDLLRLLRLQ